MNVGEWGITHNFNVNFNISGYTSLSLTYTRPDETTFTRTNPTVTVGAVPLVTPDDGIFAANQYSIYVFQTGDLNQVGTYSVRLTYTDASKNLISDVATFTVNE